MAFACVRVVSVRAFSPIAFPCLLRGAWCGRSLFPLKDGEWGMISVAPLLASKLGSRRVK